MADQSTPPPIRIRFRFNTDTGDIDLIVDDSAPGQSEDYHDRVARAIAGYLARNPEISDAGHIRFRLDQEWRELIAAHEEEEKVSRKETLTD